MKPSQHRDRMRKFGKGGVFGSDGCPILVFVLLAFSAGGMWWLRPTHRRVKAVVVTAPLPVVKPNPAPLRLQWQPRLAAERNRLDLAETALFHYVPSPSQWSEEEEGPEDSELVQETAAEEAVKSSLATEISGRAYADLGEVQLRNNHYDRAVKYFTHAFQISPQAVSVQLGLERSWHGQRVAKRIRSLLPSRQKMQFLLPFPVPGRTLWAVLAGEDPEGPDDYMACAKAQCFVFEEHSDQRLTRLWKSEVISSEDGRSLCGLGLWAWPMTGHKIPELVFVSDFVSGSWTLSTMHVYRWRDGSLQQVSATESACSHWITRLPRTGRYQVRTLDLIGGIEMGHGGLVHWPRIYDWNGSRYVAANEKHPDHFHKVRRDILDHLKQYPDNPALWKHLGYTYLYDHQRRSAFAAFRKAERAYCVQLQDKDMSVYAEEGLRELAEARAGK